MSLPPGSMGLPLIGETPAFLRNPFRFLEARQRRYGDVFRSRVLFRRVVFLAGIEGAEAFFDDGRITRTDAHPFPLVDLFGGDNMEMFDGERHLRLKTATLAAFDEEMLGRYVVDVVPPIDATLGRLASAGGAAALPELRRLAIECIWTNVLGPPGDARAEMIARDYGAVLAGLTSLPLAIPGTPYGRAHSARDRLLARIAGEVARRRDDPEDDGLSRMLRADPTMSDREAQLEVHHFVIAGFITYLLMGEVLRRLGELPELRARCEEEVEVHATDGVPSIAAIDRMTTCTNVVKEAKRIVPIVPLAFGRARRSFEVGGHDVPEGWTVYLALHLNNHDPRSFRDPWTFDPARFDADREEHRAHAMAFIPQGAEPPTGHRCLGLDYSTVLVLAFMCRLLRGYTWTLPAQSLEPNPRVIPPEPRDGLRVALRQRPA